MSVPRFEAGQVIRTKPLVKGGHFGIYRIDKIDGFSMELSELNKDGTVFAEGLMALNNGGFELYEFAGFAGTYRVGGSVRLFGYTDQFTVNHFHYSKSSGLFFAICECASGCIAQEAHLVRPFDSVAPASNEVALPMDWTKT